MAALVWVLRKMRHYIQSGERPVIVRTDHIANKDIARQKTLQTTSTGKMNLRLVNASQYISSFGNIDVRHVPGKRDLIPDALSRLINNRRHEIPVEDGQPIGELDNLAAYQADVAKIPDDFVQNLKQDYEDDERWKKIMDTLTEDSEQNFEGGDNTNEEAHPAHPEEHTIFRTQGPSEDQRQEMREKRLKFFITDDLIYHYDPTWGKGRLCIPASLEKDVLAMAHDQRLHAGFKRTYQHFMSSCYLIRMAREVRTYIKHCPTCGVNRTHRHQPYGALRPLRTPPIPFHTQTLDFILALPTSGTNKKNHLLTITEKFSKRVHLIPDMKTYGAAAWQERFSNTMPSSVYRVFRSRTSTDCLQVSYGNNYLTVLEHAAS